MAVTVRSLDRPVFGVEREKFINHKQINNVTIKIINSCGRLPARKIPSSWPPMQIQIILLYM